MAKSGLKNGTPANGKTNPSVSQLRKDMNVQASGQARMASASRLNLNTEGRGNRPFKMVMINGVSVKRFL